MVCLPEKEGKQRVSATVSAISVSSIKRTP